MKITNTADISLTLAVWLLHDEYDYIDDPDYISVTALMKPIRQIVLPRRIPPQERTADIQDFIPRQLGHAIHDSMEKAWTKGYARSLKLLGYPQHIVDRIRINPSDTEIAMAPGDWIDIHLEQRGIREIDDMKLGGKFDMVADGMIQDNKSTSAYSWLFGTKDDDHRLQGSLYRWIDAAREHPRVKEDIMMVNYIFTDWQKMQARTNPKYPQKRVEHKTIKLLSLEETEKWIREKLAQVRFYMNVKEKEIPECTDEELWRSDPQYKYYADPAKTDGRSTRNFDNLAEANRYKSEKGKGVVITKLGEPKACGYCAAFDACTQKDRYL